MWLILLVCVSTLFGQTDVIHLPREDGSLVEGYLSAPENSKDFPVVVFVDGSFDASIFSNHEKLALRFNSNGIGLLSLEKRGFSSEGCDREEYLQHDCFEERLKDYTLLLKALEEKAIPGCNGDCVVLGGSEGGKIAPRLSLSFPAVVKGLVLIGSGGGLSFGEEMKFQSWQLYQQMGFFEKKFRRIRGTVHPDRQDELYAKILASPNSLEMCGPKTWKWFASYLRYDLLADLLKVEAPIYMIHGEQDIFVPIRSADLVKEAFENAQKENLTFARYEDLGHALAGREDVYQSMIDWICSVSFADQSPPGEQYTGGCFE
jgi:pimeloyl-ACP methyl ester carboxylesterase